MQATQQTTDYNGDSRRDDMLWQMAKRRAAFKFTLVAYVLVNLFLIGVWYFTKGPGTYFWPMWPLMGWGIGLAFQYYGAYRSDTMFSVEKEYEKLKRKG